MLPSMRYEGADRQQATTPTTNICNKSANQMVTRRKNADAVLPNAILSTRRYSVSMDDP